MTKEHGHISLRTAAVIAGFAVLGMVICAPFAEIYVYPKLVIPGNIAVTATNIKGHQALFAAAILAYTLTCIFDLLAAWALYILLRPINAYLAMLTAWFRLVYTTITIVSILNLVTVFHLINDADNLTIFKPDELPAQVMLLLNAFRYGFHFGILFFGIHLVFLGYLVYRSGYIPPILGILLVLSGLGYLATALKPILYPTVNIDFAVYTFYGELIFMLWLLIKGWKIREPTNHGVSTS